MADRHGLQQEIATKLVVVAEIDAADEIEKRVSFLVEYANRVAAKGFVLGISGGQDSSLAGRLAQLAASRIRKNGGDATFVAVRLPYGAQHDAADAQLALDFIAPDQVISVDIKPGVDALVETITAATGEQVSDFNKGNVKARARMVAQYAIAGDRNMLVIGTDHAAEAVNGFFTKFGDGAADIVPLAGLNKNQGAALLRELAAPSRLWQKVPTADLLDGDPGQSDEESLGVSYSEIDAYLTGAEISADAARLIERRYLNTEHKRRLPVTPDDTWWKDA